ncbi:MAG TPA: hypothetical protein VNK95_02330 [Caldilineaceae bacterium]|nr:hypothetical protein [Caldilineaceae bacterium]
MLFRVRTPSSLLRARLQRAIERIWRWLQQPWLLLICALLSLLLLAGAWLLPQLPGQLNDEPATASRWLLTTSNTYGVWGNLWRLLGLYNVLHSGLLQLLLVLLALLGAVQLADLLGALRQFMGLATLLERPATAAGEPLPIAPLRPVYRLRTAYHQEVAPATAALAAGLAERFPTVQRVAVALPADEEAASTEQPAPSPAGSPDDQGTNGPHEVRLLGVRHQPALYLRLLLPTGLWIALAGVWAAIAFGWQVASPTLAPGDAYRSVNHGLEVRYLPPTNVEKRVEEQAIGAPQMSVRVDSRNFTYTVPSAVQFRVGSATARISPGAPALWIASAGGEPLLARPGETERREALGLVFPSAGSEESLLLPDLAAGLRLVRAGAPGGFILELYRSTTVEPVMRIELAHNEPALVPLEEGDAQDKAALWIVPLPALQVDVRYLPGLWLAWIGVAVALVGVAGLGRQPAFALVQIGPWPPARAVVVLQSSHPAELAALAPDAASPAAAQPEAQP